jgi:hypothetical protein
MLTPPIVEFPQPLPGLPSASIAAGEFVGLLNGRRFKFWGSISKTLSIDEAKLILIAQATEQLVIDRVVWIDKP